MNRALPLRDRGHRNGSPRGQSRHPGLMPGALRLVSGTANPPEREKPLGRNPAARANGGISGLCFHGVGAFPILAVSGCDGQAHLLADRTGKEASDGMGLPTGGFHQFFAGGASRPLQQIQDLRGLAPVSGGTALFLGLGRFLGGAGLLARLSFLGGATWARCFATLAFLLGFGWSPVVVA
jgi:hypothetical protein